QEMADRVGVINRGELILVEEKAALMQKLGKKQLILQLASPLDAVPEALSNYHLALSDDHKELTYTYDKAGERTGITSLLQDLREGGVTFKDLRTEESSLEDIFVSLVRGGA
ncbi:MAG: multidrug ABC transporter ATP-binding protein, partial [Luteibacter sp.]